MEQIVGERQDEQRSRRSIEEAFDITVFDKTSVPVTELCAKNYFQGFAGEKETLCLQYRKMRYNQYCN